MIISTFAEHVFEAARQLGEPLEKTAERCIAAGLNGIDAPISLFEGDRNKDIEILRSAGMHINSMPVHSDLLHNPSLQYAEYVVKTAAEKSASVILIIPGLFCENDDKNQLMQDTLKPIEFMCKAAAEYGIAVGIEDFDNSLSPLLGIEGVKWYLERIPELTCVFDTGNFIYAGEDAFENYKELKSRITKQVHCKDRASTGRAGEKAVVCTDGTKLYPAAVGNGIIPIAEIVGNLAASGFDGSFTVEIFNSAEMMQDIEDSVKYLKTIIKI